MSMYNERIERLINAALADGELTEKEKQILFKNAQAEGIDLDEFEMILESRLYEKQKEAQDAAQAQALAMAQLQTQQFQAQAQAQTAQAQAQAAQAQAQAAQTPPPVAPKSTKFGDIRKCPACGAIVAAGSASCLECGYAFTEDAGTTAMDKLYDRLKAIDDKYANKSLGDSFKSLFTTGQDAFAKPKEKMEAIKMFNVPNTRAELLGLLSSLQPLADPEGPQKGFKTFGNQIEDLSYGYWLLFVNCINKAKISFANDKTFEPYFQFYEEKTAPKKKGGFFSMFKK